MKTTVGEKTELKLDNLPVDSISDIQFSMNKYQTLIGATSWDGFLKIWHFKEGLDSASLVAQFSCKYKNSFLRLSFRPDADICYVGALDGKLFIAEPDKPELIEVIAHMGPVFGLRWSISRNELISAGLDQIIYFWYENNTTSSKGLKCSFKIDLSFKPIYLDCSRDIIGLALSEDQIGFINLKSLDNKTKSDDKSLIKIIKAETGSVLSSIFLSENYSFIVSSHNGRFSFGKVDINSQNAINIELNNNHFSSHTIDKAKPERTIGSNRVVLVHNKSYVISAGSDGKISFINYDNPINIKKTEKEINKHSVTTTSGYPCCTAIAIHPKLNIYAVSSGYDWAKGAIVAKDKGIPQPEIYLYRITKNDFGIDN